jgi:glyoxylase-like metal-dependent hydrolase (beta-lactamase superfamily II)
MTKNIYFLMLLFSVAGLAQATEQNTVVRDYPFEKVASHTWVIHGPLGLPSVENQGFMNNPGLVITSAGVVIVDPGSSLQSGEMVLRMIKKISDKPVVAVFNTHIHGDHWLGNQAIKAAYPKAKIYGHPKMLAAIEAGEGETWVQLMDRMTKGATKGTQVVGPGHSINNGDVIKVGEKSFRIHHYGQAHTITDIMIEVAEESVIFLGDNTTNQRIPRMIDGNFKGSLQTIKTILKLEIKTWVPGHGPTDGRAMVVHYQNYLSKIYQAAKKAFNDDLDSSDVKPLALKATTEYSQWSGYKKEIGRHSVQAYAEVEAAEF